MAILLAIIISFLLQIGRGYVIEGSIDTPIDASSDWFVNTQIHVDGGQYLGFVKPDGSFTVSNVPSGSYMIEAINPTYIFQIARVDISSKGRIRARRVNAPQPNAVKELPYPLRLSYVGKAAYFKLREQLRTIDLIFNPNVLYVLVPFLLIMVLTKLVNTNDPEFQREMQQMNILNTQQQMPDMSEFLSSLSLFGGSSTSGSGGGTGRKASSNNKRKTAEKMRQSTTTGSNEPGHPSSSSTSANLPPSTSRKSTKPKKAD